MTAASPVITDVITYVRRILKTPNTQDISDSTILDYINRFYTFDMVERFQLFQLRTQYSFETVANVDRYQVPIDTYNVFMTPCFVDGYQVVWQQSTDQFNKLFPNLYNNQQWQAGNGTQGAYSITVDNIPVIRGFTDDNGLTDSCVFVTATDVNGNQNVAYDDGAGNLLEVDPLNPSSTAQTVGSVNYLTGAISVTFLYNIPATSYINTQTIPYLSLIHI